MLRPELTRATLGRDPHKFIEFFKIARVKTGIFGSGFSLRQRLVKIYLKRLVTIMDNRVLI